MAEDGNPEDDPYGADLWIWENQCFDEVENQPNYESQLHQERDVVNQKLWHLFQNSATCIAQLHKGSNMAGIERNTRWLPFQTAAGSVTALYKESVDGMRRCTELGVLYGQQRRTRDLAHFLRRRRLIRREELLSFLCGKPLPAGLLQHRHRSTSRAHAGLERSSPAARLSPATSILLTAAAPPAAPPDGDAPQPYRDALAINSLQGAMSTVSVRAPSPPVAGGGAAGCPSGGARRRSPGRRPLSGAAAGGGSSRGSPGPAEHPALKRPATPSSPCDVTMDSPSHKRPRHT